MFTPLKSFTKLAFCGQYLLIELILKSKQGLLKLNYMYDMVTFTAVPPLGAFSFLSASALPEAAPPPVLEFVNNDLKAYLKVVKVDTSKINEIIGFYFKPFLSEYIFIC